jgi:hypothetical protein
VGSNDEQAPATVRSSDVGSCKIRPLRIEPESGKVREHSSQSRRPQSEHVFDDDDRRRELLDDSPVLEPEPGAGAVEPSSLACEADVLAWEPAADDIHGSCICSADRSNILVPRRFRPVLREHLATPRIDFALPHDVAEAGAL